MLAQINVFALKPDDGLPGRLVTGVTGSRVEKFRHDATLSEFLKPVDYRFFGIT